MVSDILKKIIFKQLYKELSKVEIIPYNDSIYFIDREKMYWYFEYEKSGRLWWRHDFFSNFFLIFSMERDDYEKIMGEWVEEVLNYKVSTTTFTSFDFACQVEEVLNYKVSTTVEKYLNHTQLVEEVLNYKVSTTINGFELRQIIAEEVLNYKVNTINPPLLNEMIENTVEEVLNHKVDKTK